MRWIPFPDKQFKVYGLPWFQETTPSLVRLPARMKKLFRESLWLCGQFPTGGRIRFATDSTFIGINAETPPHSSHHMPRTGHSGFDVYVEKRFAFSAWPDPEGKILFERKIAVEKKVRPIEIYLPIYNSATLHAIGLDKGASIFLPPPYRIKNPVVFYGTSVTQGGCSSNPGTTWQGFLSRGLDIDFVNLGFSGQGWGDVEIGDILGETPASCIVLDYWGNVVYNPLGTKGSVAPLVGRIRKVHSKIPIILTGPYFFPLDFFNNDHDIMRKEFQQAVRRLRANGDTHLHFFDSRRMIGPEETCATVDGAHATSLGFYLMAKAFAPLLKKVLSL
ncbi:MAG: SGNH/GDSL hydrolase family protein [Candidatus Ratteibacteria bacterium]|jgi:lysophospholipase L1-like esterase